MTTQDYADAYEDDSENVRSWPAQDTQEPEPDPAPCNCPEHLAYRAALAFNSQEPAEPDESVPYAQWSRPQLYARLERLQRGRDAALAAIARVEALASHWEQCRTRYISIPEAAAQLLQAIDEAALGITGETVA